MAEKQIGAPVGGGCEVARRSKSRAWRQARARRGLTWTQRKAHSKRYTLGKVA